MAPNLFPPPAVSFSSPGWLNGSRVLGHELKVGVAEKLYWMCFLWDITVAPQVPLSLDGKCIKKVVQFGANLSFTLRKRNENTQRVNYFCADFLFGQQWLCKRYYCFRNFSIWLSIKIIHFLIWNFHLTEVEVSGLLVIGSAGYREVEIPPLQDLPFSEHKHHLLCSVLKCLNSKPLVRFLIHCLIKIMQIHCISVKWGQIFGRESTHFFCPNASGGEQGSGFPCRCRMGGGMAQLAASLPMWHCSHRCFGVNQLLKASKMGKLWSRTKCCCH